MKAVILESLEQPPTIRDDVPAPAPGANEVLVRVHASSVNPVDNAIAAGMLAGMIEHQFPVTLGRDYAGVVHEVGADVIGFSDGDEVFGFVRHADPIVHKGSWTELITVQRDVSIARTPARVDLATAGAAPLAGVTALTAVDALGLSDGDRVLVVGATGGVGSLAVQLATHAAATVLAPALPEDESYLRGLGVDVLLPRDGDLAAAVREHAPDGADALLDLVSYQPGAFDAALKPDARVASSNSAAGDGPGRTDVMALPTTENLQRLAALLDDGTLRLPIQDSYDLERAADALQALASSHSQGKLAIQIA